MKPIAVFIATTAGPVRIVRITRERAPQSMVCLKRSSTVLPISDAYDSFVRLGSGVIEKVFGPFDDGAFRLDVAAPIESGESWQLGVFVAHALTADGTALASEDDAESIVWLTGEVDCDLGVGTVGHLAEKIHASRDALNTWCSAGRRVTLFVPTGNDLETMGEGLPGNARIVAVHTVTDVLAAMGLAIPDRAPLARNRSPAVRAGGIPSPARWLAGGLAAATVTTFIALHWPAAPVPAEHSVAFAAPRPAPIPVAEIPKPDTVTAVQKVEITTPAPAFDNLRLVERRAPEGHSCAEVQFGGVAAREIPIAADAKFSASDGLCGLGVEVDNGESADYVAVTLDVVTGKLLYGSERPDAFAGQKSFAGRREWAIDLPRRLNEPFEFRLTAIRGPRAVGDESKWLAIQPDSANAVKQLESKGYSTILLHARVEP